MSPILSFSAPRCCGCQMRDVTEGDEEILGLTAWICDRCKWECQTRGRAPNSKRHPELFGIRVKARRFEVRVPGGANGLWLYVGMAVTIQEALRLRDQARQGRLRAA